mgnify:CR=1 FL=1
MKLTDEKKKTLFGFLFYVLVITGFLFYPGICEGYGNGEISTLSFFIALSFAIGFHYGIFLMLRKLFVELESDLETPQNV